MGGPGRVPRRVGALGDGCRPRGALCSGRNGGGRGRPGPGRRGLSRPPPPARANREGGLSMAIRPLAAALAATLLLLAGASRSEADIVLLLDPMPIDDLSLVQAEFRWDPAASGSTEF